MAEHSKRLIRDLMGKNIVVFDIEIKNPISKETQISWADHDKMGISVAVAFDYRDWCFKVYMDDNIGELVDRLNEPDTLVVAFNNKGFDNKLLRKDLILTQANKILKPDEELNQYDMLEESRAAFLGNANGKKGFKLDDHLAAMKLPMKNGDGADAPKLYKSGDIGKLITYTVNDVKVEKAMFDQIYLTGKVANGFQPLGFHVKDPAKQIKGLAE